MGEGFEMNLSMQRSLFDPRLARPVTVIGAGSVGSLVVDMLVRAGCTEVTVIDGDFVDSHNVAMSGYGVREVGRYKVDALRERVALMTGVEIKAERRMYADGEPLQGTVIACVDTMTARLDIFRAVAHNSLVDWLLDTRLAERFYEVYCTTANRKDEAERYAVTLFADVQAVRRTCGNHGIIFVSATVAALAVATVTTVWSGGRVPWRQWNVIK